MTPTFRAPRTTESPAAKAALAWLHTARFLVTASKLDELPFDFHRKRQSVLVRRDGAPLLITKGAVERVLAVCARRWPSWRRWGCA